MDLLIYSLVLIIVGLLQTNSNPAKKSKRAPVADGKPVVIDLPIGQNLQLARITGAYTYILKELRLK